LAKYLLRGSYTSEAWAAQVKDPKNRIEIVRPVFEQLGGSIESAYFSFGDDDLVIIMEMPDNVSAAALSIAVSAGGAVQNIKTAPLMSMDEGLEAIVKAGSVGYRPPSS